MSKPPLWPKYTDSTSGIWLLPPMSSRLARQPNGWRRSTSTTPPVRSCSSKSRCFPNIIRRGPNSGFWRTGRCDMRVRSPRRGVGRIRRGCHHTKVRLLLNKCQFGSLRSRGYFGRVSKRAVPSAAAGFSQLAVYPVTADFTAPFALPKRLPGCRRSGFFRDRRWGISSRMKPVRSCAPHATFSAETADADRYRPRERRARAVQGLQRQGRDHARGSTWMSSLASTGNWAAISTPPLSVIARSTIASVIGSKCT